MITFKQWLSEAYPVFVNGKIAPDEKTFDRLSKKVISKTIKNTPENWKKINAAIEDDSMDDTIVSNPVTPIVNNPYYQKVIRIIDNLVPESKYFNEKIKTDPVVQFAFRKLLKPNVTIEEIKEFIEEVRRIFRPEGIITVNPIRYEPTEF